MGKELVSLERADVTQHAETIPAGQVTGPRGLLPQLGGLPEVRLAVWGFLLNGLWEFLQSPLYADWHREWTYLLWTRLHCTAGDVLILLCSFWGSSVMFKTRHWMGGRPVVPVVVFVTFEFGYTVWSEWFNTGIRAAWGYSPTMPQVLGLGVTPLVQWVVVPILMVTLFRAAERRRGSPVLRAGLSVLGTPPQARAIVNRIRLQRCGSSWARGEPVQKEQCAGRRQGTAGGQEDHKG